MDIKVKEHPLQVKPARIGISNSVKHEAGSVLLLKLFLKDTAMKCILGRNHINVGRKHTHTATVTTVLLKKICLKTK